jgi:hypothetical protein
MATLTSSMFMALDGVVDPMVGSWHFPYFNDEMGKAVEGTHDADVMLFGRVTYDSFAGAWPAGRPQAEFGKEDGLSFLKRGKLRPELFQRIPVHRGGPVLQRARVDRCEDLILRQPVFRASGLVAQRRALASPFVTVGVHDRPLSIGRRRVC